MKYVIGIDEVGRGSLAGPVVVAAVSIRSGHAISNSRLGRLRDSKHLTRKQREGWSRHFKNHPQVTHMIARVYPRTIERINISRAANTAASRAFQRLSECNGFTRSNHKIFLDGGLFLGRDKNFPNAKTVVRGDQKIPAIKIASIIAKVSRDRFMKRLAMRYPKYGFEIHKGYGTELHRKALKKHGPSNAHRLTFLRFLQNSKR